MECELRNGASGLPVVSTPTDQLCSTLQHDPRQHIALLGPGSLGRVGYAYTSDEVLLIPGTFSLILLLSTRLYNQLKQP